MQSNLTGLMPARDTLFTRQGHPIQQDGLTGDPSKVKVSCFESARFLVQKNMVLVKPDYRSVAQVEIDAFSRIDLADLRDKLAQVRANGEQAMAIVATAGAIDAGTIDPLADIVVLAAECQIWMHVGAVRDEVLLFSNKHRDFLNGLKLTDSATLDFHEQFFQTINCGVLLLEDTRYYELARYRAAYLNSDSDEEASVPNLVSKSL